MPGKITPGFIMNQIRNGVRKNDNNPTSSKEVFDTNTDFGHIYNTDQSSKEIMNNISNNFKRLNHRVTPNIPVAFLEPHLVSRYKWLGKIIIPLRKIGTRLFTKWYADVFVNQQKHLNHDIWFGINASLEIINDQQKLIYNLQKQTYDQNLEIQELNEKFELFEIEFKKTKTLDFDYSKFAEKFSADSKTVQDIYSQYIQYFADCEDVLDIGCGKGYFLELLKENGINGFGIDSDAELINICSLKGLRAETNDAINYLNKAEDNSLSGIFMGHVIEHLPVNMKIEFLNLCLTKLKNNGVLVLETPNASSVYVMHNLYYLDPTHEKPLLPEALKHLAVVTGFSVVNSYLSGPIDENIVSPIQYYNYSLVLKKQ
ncbi:class I SAM-dependent methyltransferase [Paenibacillus sp. PL91]|uniref:class I SAM-dependent methyltransferase n=1 Tax=Paenibacillus sp. PL91 TaxID=2729538 RepID=UPI00145F55E3|nr:class I SAM-dependent methyltransferase [Paenibacillus sp. PL91]MBC9200437.1 class I SAM-dependent methyltransferase [Paenibacillus sp. PL91]